MIIHAPTNQKLNSVIVCGHDHEETGSVFADLACSHLNALNNHSHSAIIKDALYHYFIKI